MSAAVVMRNSALQVSCVPAHGMVLTEIVPLEVGENLLWQRRDAPLHDFLSPAQATAEGDPFDEQVFAGGWFGMFPNAGIPGAGDTDEQMHGTFPRFSWRVVQQSDTTLACELEVDGLRAIRMLRLEGATVRVETTVENRSGANREVSYGEHPCFSRRVFADSEISLGAVRAYTTPEVSEPGANRFAAGQEFRWPFAEERLGAIVRADVIPAVADGSHDHLCVKLADPCIELTVPLHHAKVTVCSDLDATPHLLFWRHFRPPRSPWQGDVFGIEMMSTPGRTRDDARVGGALRWLRHGEELSWSLEIQWQSQPPLAYG